MFNRSYLESKIAEALDILDYLDDRALPPPPSRIARIFRQLTLDISSTNSDYTSSPSSRNLSSHPIVIPASLAELAALPAVDIRNLIKFTTLPESLGIIRVPFEAEQVIDRFVTTLTCSTDQIRKQALGEKLFKEIKSFGIRGAVSSFPIFSRA